MHNEQGIQPHINCTQQHKPIPTRLSVEYVYDCFSSREMASGAMLRFLSLLTNQNVRLASSAMMILMKLQTAEGHRVGRGGSARVHVVH